MAGFDNGTSQGGVRAQAKQLGSVLRGFGPPVPAAGVFGDLYLDTQTKFLYERRSDGATDPWGHFLFQVPDAYADTLKWFSAFAPSNDFGVAGDYCVAWAGYANYGIEPSVYGPKQSYGWSEIGTGPNSEVDATYAGYALPAGLESEGDAVPFSSSTQVLVAGLTDEYILAIPVTLTAGTAVSQLGLAAGPVQVPVLPNPLYTATDTHAV